MKYLTLFVLFLVALTIGWVLVRSHSRPSTNSAPVAPKRIVSTQVVAKRALCLMALVQRANAEYQLHPAPGDSKSPFAPPPSDLDARISSWLRSEGLWDSASQVEKALMGKPLGSWTRQEVADSQWREESVDVLLWALQPDALMAAYDVPFLTIGKMKSLGSPPQAEAFVRSAKLRPEAEILKARDIAELWLWRSRTTQLQKEHYSPPKGEPGLEQIVSMTVAKAQKDGLFTPIHDDFPALGKPYSKLTDSKWQTLHSIATERLYALNWLCGYAENWDAVPTGT